MIDIARMLVLADEHSLWMVLKWRNMLSETAGYHHF
jgi:hypothetical protein